MKKLLLTMSGLLIALCAAATNFESAADAVKNMKVGWNLGNTLDANDGKACPDIVRSETMWGQPVTRPELMAMLGEAGFGAVRVPVTWFPHMDADGKVDPVWMKRVHEVVDYVINAGLYCILNVHHDTGDGNTHWLHASTAVYNSNKAKYEYLWQQIAEEFRDYGQQLLFESYNEMLDKYNSWCFATFNTSNRYIAADAADAYDAINSYAQSFVNVVRATGGNNSQRNLVVNTYGACCGAGNWNAHLKDPLKQMKLPQDEAVGHLAFEVHTYPEVASLQSAKNEVNDIISAVRTHLVDKGAPVIFGEWGTASADDYQNRHANMLAFARYFVEQAKANDMGTFYWMGISDASARSLPAFSQSDLAAAILQAYYGDDYQPVLPTLDDFDITYTVSYTGQWQELNLCDHEISSGDYKSVSVELGTVPASGLLQVKVYGATDDQGQYVPVSSATTTVNFNQSALGSKVRRITLQYMKTTPWQIGVNRAWLVKSDGTEVATQISPFWGCTAEAHAVSTDVKRPAVYARDDHRTYTLTGQAAPGVLRPGLYIRNGRKRVVFR